VKLWLHSDMHIWAPSFWSQRKFNTISLEAIWKFSKVTGLP